MAQPEYAVPATGTARSTNDASPFPIRPGKTQRPFLPKDTLRRDRLFRWLDAHEDCRVAVVVAEAGFGKTTLIADYLRNSRSRVLWYRLDDEEVDALIFVRYVVAAGQAVDARLFSRTSALLNETSLEPMLVGPLVDTLLADLEQLSSVPTTLVFDDFYFADPVPEILSIVDRMIARSPRAVRFIILSRRFPGLTLGALRAKNQVAELGREHLRFEEEETGRLFGETYQHPLDPDVIHELQVRTEGWAASLQLVRAAVESRSPGEVRNFVASLRGSAGSLYDYLAEEVVGDLEPGLREFLLRLSVLEEIDAITAGVAADAEPESVAAHFDDAQRIGLLGRSAGGVTTWRLHPLVREFLLSRLEHNLGADGVVRLHRHLAVAFEPQSWRLAARHWAMAGDAVEVRRVLCAAINTIIGTGDFATANELAARFPEIAGNAHFDILRSRQLASEGRYSEAAELARRCQTASRSTIDDGLAVAAALNAMHLGIYANDAEMSTSAIASLACSGDGELASIARSAELLSASRDSGSVDALCDSLHRTVFLNSERAHPRHEGISLVNLSFAETARGRPDDGVVAGRQALRLLEGAGNWADISAAHLNLAKGLAHTGRWGEAQAHIDSGLSATGRWIEPDTFAEASELMALYGDPKKAMELIAVAIEAEPARGESSYVRQVRARLAMLNGKCEDALRLLSLVDATPIAPAFGSATRALRVQILASSARPDGEFAGLAQESLAFAHDQQAWFWWKSIRLSIVLMSTREDLNALLRLMDEGDAAYLSIQAELVSHRLSELEEGPLARVCAEAAHRPERWRWALRRLIQGADSRMQDIRIAADILECVGDQDDVPTLRRISRRKSLKLPQAGRRLAKTLAPRGYVEDLGRMSLIIGDQRIPGTNVRRKVLSLLAYLLTRPQFSASREQVIDALWPEMDPEAGANSLNQTSYFLRTILEQGVSDDLAACYLDSKADLIWLDADLIRSRSADCLSIISLMRRDSSPELITRLADTYTGRFAADFLYEDWSSTFRDNLHAGYLDRIERALIADTNAGAFDRALSVAQLALKADPEAEQIELCLLRLYRRMGAAAAAAEQYTHYASVLREQLGVEPPPLDAI